MIEIRAKDFFLGSYSFFGNLDIFSAAWYTDFTQYFCVIRMNKERKRSP